jgi:Cu(I)/Ag(I) efflux system periplasmic protein CusF
MKYIHFITVFTIAIAGAPYVHAMGDMNTSQEKPAATKTVSGKGVVVSVNKEAAKLTLRHGPIPAIQWPAMTMSFKVKDKMQLDKLKKGDKVNFTLEQSGSDYLITQIKPD